MTPSEVKNYIVNDPELAALAGAPGINNDYPESKDQTICDVANARMVPGIKKVPVEDAFLYLIKAQKWRGLKKAAADPLNPATDAAFSAIELMGAPGLKVDFLDAVSNALLGGLVAASVLEAKNKTDLQAMSTIQVPETEVRFGRQLQNLDVARAFGRVGFGA